MTSAPSVTHHPPEQVLDDAELLCSGVLPTHLSDAITSRVVAALPEELGKPASVEIVDEEGVPVATVTTDTASFTPQQTRSSRPFDNRNVLGAGRAALHGRAVAVIDAPLTHDDVETFRAAAAQGPVTALVLAAAGQGWSADGLIRATLAALSEDVEVVVLRRRFPENELDRQVLDATLSALGAARRLRLDHAGALAPGVSEALALPTDTGLPGAVVLMTGLSGSGKSTLARALRDAIVEEGIRTVSLLDGDVVRRNLSAGLGFTREDRERNIRRIGWVASEIARHGGLAICSPIAPFVGTRADVRAMAEEVGAQFVLIHVATSLAECERRDRKGLYAKAREGMIPDFTGINSPYDIPDDADLRIDTEGRRLEDCLAQIVQVLRSRTILPEA